MRALDRLGVDVGRFVERDGDDAVRQRLEVVVAGDEIGLRIDFDDDAEIGFDGDADQALGGDAAALLGRLGQALLAQPVDHAFLGFATGLFRGGGRPLFAQNRFRLGEIAPGFDEGLLAIHHARAGFLAQVFHQRGANRGHGSIPQNEVEWSGGTAPDVRPSPACGIGWPRGAP